MLVLTRNSNESFVIGRHIKVRILSVHQGRVQLGIDAPDELPIWRSELLPRMCPGCYQDPCICLADDNA